MTSLRLSHRRADVIGFWLLVAAVLWLSVGFGLGAGGVRTPWAWGAAGVALVLLPGVFWPPWFDTGVRGWNAFARVAAAALQAYVLVVCYYVLVVPIAWFRSTPHTSGRPEATPWTPRRQIEIGADGIDRTSRADWWRGLSLTSRGRHRWMVCLFPFVQLLILLGDERQESAPPSSTYTLY